MIEWLDEIDKALFVFLNGFHNPITDVFWSTVTNKYTWIPLYLFFIFLMFKNYGMTGWWYLIGFFITVALSDYISSGLMKPYFERLRPCHNPELQNIIHLVLGCGSKFGFVSGHSANSFSIATFIWLLFGNRHPVWRWLFVWAAMVAYSRIAIGVHYPGDLLVGALLGLICGWMVYSVIKKTKSMAAKTFTTS
jgi:undecaprenyl-diphosphatase